MNPDSEQPNRRKPSLAWILKMAWRDTRRTRAKLALFGFSVVFGVAALVVRHRIVVSKPPRSDPPASDDMRSQVL